MTDLLAPLYDAISRLPLESMHYSFMQRALVALVLLAPMCGAMGVQVVNLRMAFFSDAISHSAFTGVAIGLLLGADARLTMLVFAVLIGVGIVALGRRSSLSIDTIIGVFFSAAVAFGLAVVSRDPHVGRNLQTFLYGDILTLSEAEVLWTAGLFAAMMAFQAFSYNRLLYVGLNPALASAHRVGVRGYQYVYAVLLSMVVIYAVGAVGVLLVTALLIVPAATARNLARSAGGMFWWAIAVSIVAAVGGLIASFHLRTATGATVILIAAALFVVSAIVRPARRRG